MHVLIVVENNSVPFDRRVWLEATTLRDMGWRVTVVCPAEPGMQGHRDPDWRRRSGECIEGIAVYRFPGAFAAGGLSAYLCEYVVAFWCIAWLSWRIWRECRFDILHVCNPPDIFFPLGLMYRLLGASFVFDHHDLFPEMISRRFSGLAGRVLHRAALLMEYCTFRSANAVIATNEAYRQIAVRRGRKPPEKVVTVRNGPKLNFRPVKPAPGLKRGFQHMVCFVGIMGEEDGVLELVDVVRHVVHVLGRRDTLFMVIGDGATRSKAQAQFAASGLSQYVDMPGMIRDDAKLRQYMSTADVFVSPEPLTALNSCSSFIKVGEYMAIGKPIVAFDLPETRNTAQEAACYVPTGDSGAFARAVVALLDDPDRRSRMGQAGLHRVNTWLAWEHQCKSLMSAYAIARSERLEPQADDVGGNSDTLAC